jgi:hypothetical protein
MKKNTNEYTVEKSTNYPTSKKREAEEKGGVKALLPLIGMSGIIDQ